MERREELTGEMGGLYTRREAVGNLLRGDRGHGCSLPRTCLRALASSLRVYVGMLDGSECVIVC